MGRWLTRSTNSLLPFIAILVSILIPGVSHATISQDWAIRASAVVQESPARITLNWPASTGTGSIYVYRKLDTDTTWATFLATLASTATQYVDTTVSAGTAYEYLLFQSDATITSGRRGYVYSGMKIPLVESRGKIVLIVDNTFSSALSSELALLQQDLVGDGWTVLRHDVNRSDSVPSVKSLILADYTADPANVKAVFLFGHVPVPYSGNLNPDGHPDHQGAWPADVFYGEMNGTWTDTTVNTTTATDPRNRNTPGDGKYDQSTIPTAVELWVGRVDLANMPAFSLSELQLLRQYLNKDHDFRQKTTTVQSRALVSDNFTGLVEGPAQTGWRFSALAGAANVSAGSWSTLTSNEYLLAYGCGAGTYTSAGGIASTANYASSTYRAMFQMLFGSYFGDWDNSNNFLRAPLCNRTYGLTSCWVARPHWFIHHMGLGKPIGHGMRLSTTSSLYYMSYSASQAHIALMGDPTLRLQYVLPPTGVSAIPSGSNASISWTASADTGILGYNVYRSTLASGPFTRLNGGSLVAGTSYSDTTPLGGGATYMIRAVRLEQSSSGTYYNASQGAFASYTPSATPPPAPVITTDGGNGAGVDYTSNNASLTLAGTCDSSLVSVQVNGEATGVTYTAGQTTWSYSGALSAGANLFSVTGTDAQPLTSSADTITITLDTTAPTVSMSSVASSPTSTSPIPVTVTLSESVTGFTAADISASNATVSGFSGSGSSYNFNLAPTGQGLVTADIAAGVCMDVAGNGNAAAAQFSRTYDSLAPTVSMSSAVAAITNSNPIPVTVTFSESVTGFAPGDITAINATVSGFSGSGSSYSFNLTPTGQGVVTANIAGGVCVDAAGNSNTAAAQFSRNYDSAAPTVSMSSGTPSITNSNPIPVTLIFSESVTGFTSGDISASNATVSGFSGSGSSYSFNLTPSGQGAVAANIAGGVCVDPAGNGNTAATQFSRTFDSVVATVSMSSATSSPTNTSPIPVTVTFSESVTGFTSGDISTSNATVTGFTGSGSSYSFNLTPSGQGAVTADIGGGLCIDAAGNGNGAAPQFSRTYDSVAPTVSMTSATSSPTNSSPIAVTVTFSESVTGFTSGDIIASNATVSGFAGSGASYSFDLTPSGQGVVTADIPGGVCADPTGNANTAAPQFSRTYDSAGPAVTLASGSSGAVNGAVTVTVTLSESSANLVSGDITPANATVSGFSGGGVSYSFTLTPISQGVFSAVVGAGACTDALGNPNSISNTLGFTFDSVPPTVSIGAPSSTITATGPVSYMVTYGAADTITLGTGDITLLTTGTAAASISVTGSGTTSRTVTLSGISGDGTLGISIGAGSASDAAGNTAPSAGPSASFTVGALSIAVNMGTPFTVTRSGPIDYVVTYNNAVSVTLSTGDITLMKTGTADATVLVTGSGTVTRTVTLSGVTGDGTLGITIAAGTATDASSNSAPASGPSPTVEVDNTAPAVTMTSTAPTATKTGPIPVTIAFSESVTGFDSGDITPSNATVSGFTGSGASYSFDLTPSGQGLVTADIAGGACLDAAGNGNAAAAQFSRTYDSVAPTVSMSSAAAPLTNTSPIPVTVTFSESVTGFTLGNITASNAAVSGFAGSGSSYTFNLTPIGQGVVTADIAGGVCADAAENSNTAAAQFSRTYDSAPPTASLSSVTPSSTNTSPIPVTVTFSESVTGFSAGDISASNATVNAFAGSGSSYSFDLTPSGQGVVTADIAGGVCADAAGNGNAAASQFSRTYDSAPPTVTMSSAAASTTNTSPIPVTVTFSESVTGFTVGDISASNAAISGFTGSGANYSFNLTPSGQGAVTADVAGGVCVDAAGNGNSAAGQFSRTYDSAPPTVSMSSVTSSLTNESPIPVTVTFTESVTGFSAGDVIASNATVGGFTGSGSSYNFNLTPSGQGAVTADIAAGVCADAAGNSNAAAAQFSRTYDSVAPTVSMNSALPSPTNTSPIPVTVTFSEPVTGFSSGDISVSNATVSGFSGSGASYSFDLIPNAQGAIVADIASGACTDAAGNANAAASQFSRNFDSVAPTVTITSNDPDPTRLSPIAVIVTFSESVTGFTVSDLAVTNGLASNFTGSGASYSFDLVPSGQGSVTLNIAAGVAQDAVGNGNTAATPFSRTYDSIQPAISIGAPSPGIAASGPATYAVNYTGADGIGLSASEITLITTGTATASIAVSGTGTTTRTVTLSGITGDGTLGISIVADTASDNAGNLCPAPAPSATVTIDNTRPVITLLGDNPIQVNQNTSYSDPGATAWDTHDGDLSGAVVVNTSAVDVSAPGTYTVTYDVMDAAGNPAVQVTRTVEVMATSTPPLPLSGLPIAAALLLAALIALRRRSPTR